MNETFKKIDLVVDDEPQIVKVLKAYLEKAGYQVVTAAERGKTALLTFQREKPDFLILDLNLPDMDGLDICKIIRHDSNVPILMLTARVEEADRLIGLELGADDYVLKPFSPRESGGPGSHHFQAHPGPPRSPSREAAGGRPVDRPGSAHRHPGGPVDDLTPTEFEILVALAKQPKRVFSRLHLLEQAQGDAFEGYERTIDAHIKNIRG